MSAISLDTVSTQQVKHLTRVVIWVSACFGWSEPTIVDSDYLRQLPPGTFGRVWLSTMDAAGLSPFATGPRRQQLHDGIHALTGYNRDPLGEAEVQAFLLGAKFRVSHSVILSQLILAVGLFKPVARRVGQGYGQVFGLPELVKYAVKAYKRGRMAELAPEQWQPETMWELPFEEVQAQFNVLPNRV